MTGFILSTIFWAMARWRPIVSMVTIAPSIGSMSSNFGMAVISLDFSAAFT